MKLYNLILKDLKIFLSSAVFYFLGFIVLPFLVGILNGTAYQNQINPDRKLDKINVAFVNKDNGMYGNVLKKIFAGNKMKDIVRLKNESSIEKVKAKLEKGTYDTAVYIPENFSNSIADKKDSSIKVYKAPSAGTTSQVVYNTVQSYVIALKNNKAVNYSEIVSVKGNKILSSKQILMISMFAAVSLYIIVALGNCFLLEKEKGTYARLRSTSLSNTKIFVSKVLGIFIISISVEIIYIYLCSIIGISFGNSIFNLILMILLHAFLISGVFAVCISIFESVKLFNVVAAIIISSMTAFGGAFFPVEKVGGIFYKLSKLTFNGWIQKGYYNVMLGKNNNAPMIVMLTCGLIGIIAGYSILMFKERRLGLRD